MDTKELKKEFSKEEVKLLLQAIAYHHERGDYNATNYKERVEALKSEAENFNYDKVKITRIKKIGVRYFSNNRIYEDSDIFRLCKN